MVSFKCFCLFSKRESCYMFSLKYEIHIVHTDGAPSISLRVLLILLADCMILRDVESGENKLTIKAHNLAADFVIPWMRTSNSWNTRTGICYKSSLHSFRRFFIVHVPNLCNISFGSKQYNVTIDITVMCHRDFMFSRYFAASSVITASFKRTILKMQLFSDWLSLKMFRGGASITRQSLYFARCNSARIF